MHEARPHRTNATRARRACLLLVALLAFAFCAAPAALAQRRFERNYPAQPNIRVQLLNKSGTIEVLAWNKKIVRVTATMESPAAKMTPEVSDEGVLIDARRDNRDDVGDINFKIQVPAGATVDISTMRGNITIRNVQGQMVRARVSTEGDIELTGIRAQTVMAENTVGNILFDAELLRGGTYVLNSTQGDIQLRITAESGFRLMAIAPRTRNIELNGFAQKGEFEFFNDKRKVVGKVGDGGAALSTTNGRGSIVFMPR
jgi:Putative adhesin